MFAGVHTALVTPLSDNLTLDAESFRDLIDKQFDNGVTGVVPMGTTGESPTFSHEEHTRVVQLTVKQAAGRGPVIAGTGSNSTKEAISLTQAAEQAGADAALLVTPYYNKPSQEGLFQHYRAIAESTELPIMLYSIPGRCHIQIEVETVVRLAAECPNIQAIKEASGDPQRVIDLRAALPDDFAILSGDDALTVEFMKNGADGVVSVFANLAPTPLVDMVAAMKAGDVSKAEEIHSCYEPLFRGLLKLDTNPVPIKAALALAGECSARLRLPLVEMPEEKVEELRGLLSEAEIL